MNAIVIFCPKKEQAFLWENCKAGSGCPGRKSQTCLFNRIVKAAGTADLGSASPVRLCSVEEATPLLDAFKEEYPRTIRTPVPPQTAGHQGFVVHSTPSATKRKPLKTAPAKVPERTYSSTDKGTLLAEAIKDEAAEK